MKLDYSSMPLKHFKEYKNSGQFLFLFCRAVSVFHNLYTCLFMFNTNLQVVAGGDVSVITSQQQDPPTSNLTFSGLTSSSIFQDDLG